ncbi:MAG TPA: isoleucine--tRNA ligase [Gemmatimonadales bacterium]|nr:isoleucine--tRNA ligase [Gemmatimonadales bacterium]
MATYPAWPDLSADELERRQLELWKSEALFHRTLEASKDGPPYVFYEGPPTANGRPGIHHVFARTIKDLMCRFHAMQGKQVTRIAGWDTHGLPVEIEVEKELGINGKRDIERFGVAEFNARARQSVFKYQSEWEELSDRIAFWLDYAHPYVTCSNDYVESVWWLLRRLHERELLYRGHRVLPYCPRCGTVLSSHELALGYEEVTTNSIYVTFPLESDPSRQLLIWTTTPWTLLANVAVAVHPDLEYAEYPVDGRTIILAIARADLPSGLEEIAPGAGGVGTGRQSARARKTAVPFRALTPLRTFKGRELVGLRYRRPLDVVPLPDDRVSRVVIGADFVTADDGSGLVHMAPAFGADDYAAGQQHNLALVRPVAADGTFSGTEWPEIEGRRVTDRETNDLIVQRLKREGRWHLTQPHTHTYPHCWRCASPLIYYARDSWFVRTSALKDRMLAHNATVDWHPPEVGSGRFGEWLANNVDWALSRDRYWGTPLPVWVCDRDPSHVEVVGSYEQLAARWGKPLPEEFDPHKPYIDGYAWTCACGGRMARTPEVIDAWFDSGAMPYAQWHWPFEHDAEFRAHFPADFICEGVDQTRGWFYSLLAIATAVFDSPAYRHVIVNELVLDAEGQKMSKSRGNVVDPWEMIGEFGADTIRVYLLASSQVWLPKRFDRRTIPEVAGGFFETLKHTYGFFQRYAASALLDSAPPAARRPHADRWILGRLDTTIDAVRGAWEGYDVTAGVRAIMMFVVDDLSNWYVRLNRSRFWAPGRDADPAAVATLHEALVTVACLLAPAAPFMADWLHRALAGTSVHLARFPQSAGRRDAALDTGMEAVRQLASLGRAARQEADIRVRQPLRHMQVAVPAHVRTQEFGDLLDLLRQEVNVKEPVNVVVDESELVRLKGKPNFRSLGKRFGKLTPEVAAATSRLTPDQLRALERGEPVSAPLNGAEITYLPEDVTVEREVASKWLVQSSGPFVTALDPEIDDELRREGIAREMVNRVQRLRKEAGYEFTSRIRLWIAGDPRVLEAVSEYGGLIKEETLARELVIGSRAPAADLEQELEVDGLAVVVGVRRYSESARGGTLTTEVA